MRNQRILSLLLAGLLAAGLTACGGAPAGTAEETAEAPKAEAVSQGGVAASDLRAGLILKEGEDDPAARAHIEGLEAACRALGLRFDSQVLVRTGVSENAACGEAVKELLAEGCQILFADAPGHENFLTAAASRNPGTDFCQAGGYQGVQDNLENTHDYYPQIEQARYLTGVAAGLRTGTHKLGYVAEDLSARNVSAFTAFYLGARSVDPEAVLVVSCVGKDGDEAVSAQALIDQDCDVIAQQADSPVPAAAAQTNGVWAVGYGTDRIPDAPEAALVSCRIDWSVYYTYALGCLLSGEALGQDWSGSWAEGACALTPWNEPLLGEGTVAAAEAAAAGLTAGTVSIYAGPLHGADADGNELTLAAGESYEEHTVSSAPSFAFLVDGITVLP